MSYTDKSIKKAVEELRDHHLLHFNNKLKPTHAHEMVAACFGYNSKIALKSDASFELDPDDPETFEFPDCEENIQKRIEKLKGLNIEQEDHVEYVEVAADIILSAITPECSICHEFDKSVRAAETDHKNPEQLWACHSCASEGEEVGFCKYCGENKIYPIDMLNDAWECPEHAGESSLTEEEEADYESYMEYWENHGYDYD